MNAVPSAGVRVLTVVAAAFLAFDGVALIVAGVWLHRPLLVAGGATLIVGSLLVGAFWRRHKRQLQDLQEARRALAGEARQLQDLIRRN